MNIYIKTYLSFLGGGGGPGAVAWHVCGTRGCGARGGESRGGSARIGYRRGARTECGRAAVAAGAARGQVGSVFDAFEGA